MQKASPIPEIGTLSVTEIMAALCAGRRDFVRAPAFGTAFSSVYVAAGLALVWLGAGTFLWTLALALGFPLVAPFAAVGLYEVSRRLQAREPLDRSAVLSIVWAERGRQLPWMGVVLSLLFLFWSVFADMSFALFLGLGALGRGALSLEAMLTGSGLLMIAFQLLAGGAVAFLAMLPAFLGLFVALPVLGHATWHLYRRALYDPV